MGFYNRVPTTTATGATSIVRKSPHGFQRFAEFSGLFHYAITSDRRRIRKGYEALGTRSESRADQNGREKRKKSEFLSNTLPIITELKIETTKSSVVKLSELTWYKSNYK